MILSACCPAVASAAIATRSFAAVWAYALAIINEVVTSVTTRQFAFFCCHSVRLCNILLASACELSFRKRKPNVSIRERVGHAEQQRARTLQIKN